MFKFDVRFKGSDIARAVEEANRAALTELITGIGNAAAGEAPEDTGELKRRRTAPRVYRDRAEVRFTAPYARATLGRSNWIARAVRRHGRSISHGALRTWRAVFRRAGRGSARR